MNSLYAPWRSNYTESVEEAKLKDTHSEVCIFCEHIKHPEHDAATFVLKRSKHACIMFNKYPYNAGHLLIVPNEHMGHLDHLSDETRTELMALANASTLILKKVAHAQGFNIGLNLGQVAGGSIPAHLHMHVLPRWIGDTNFLPTLGETKVISFDLVKMYADLKPHFDTLAF